MNKTTINRHLLSIFLLRSILLLFITVFALGCSPNQFYSPNQLSIEKSLEPIEHIGQYPKNMPFRCVRLKPKLDIPPAAIKSFAAAEKNLSTNLPLDEKVKAYRKANEEGHPKALERIVELYRYHDETNKKSGDAEMFRSQIAETYHEMLEKQQPVVYAHLANIKLNAELGMKKDPNRAFDYLYYGSSLGEPNAQALLGDYYFYVLGEYIKGVAAHNCAISQNLTSSYHSLATAAMIFEKDYPKSLSYHLQAASRGHKKSVTFLRGVFRDGLYGYSKNPELEKCFSNFVSIQSTNPRSFSAVQGLCKLPDHPDAAQNMRAFNQEEREKTLNIYLTERKFNPNKEKPKEEEKKLRKKPKEKSKYAPSQLKVLDSQRF